MKKITTVLFDLDGTLIRMDQDEFIKQYFISIISRLSALGTNADLMRRALETAVVATLKNDGSITNEQRFWQTFRAVAGDETDRVEDEIKGYYEKDFLDVIQATCSAYPRTREILNLVKSRGLRSVLATNPLFPTVATYHRIELGGMSPSEFEYITAYENSSFCKPNPAYFTELLSRLKIAPEECVMIGNDTRDDFCAHALGIPVFILTPCLINKGGVDLSQYPHGDFDELAEYIESLR